MKNYFTDNTENNEINNIYKKSKVDNEKENADNNNIKINDAYNKKNTDKMEDHNINEIDKLKNELKSVIIENSELKKKYSEDTEKLNIISLKNASLLKEVNDEKNNIQIEYNTYKEESVKDIRRLQEELDKNVVILNRLKDEILFKEEELKKFQVIEKLYKEECEINEQNDIRIKTLEQILRGTKANENDTSDKNVNQCNTSENDQINDNKKLTDEEIELNKRELEKKNEEIDMLNKKYESLKRTNKEIEKKICFLNEELDYYKNNENCIVMQNIFNTENNISDSVCKKHLVKVSILYNILNKIIIYDQNDLKEKDKMVYSLEKENIHFLKKFIADEMYCLYLKDCISKINLTYQVDLHKQEKKYMLLNSEYDDLYNKFLFEKNENCLLNEKYDKIIFNQKKEIRSLKNHISNQNKDKELLTKYIDNYITYIENSYQQYCILNNEYKNLEELVNDLKEKNKNLTSLVNGISMGNNNKGIHDDSINDFDSLNVSESIGDNNISKDINNSNDSMNKKNKITVDVDHMKMIKSDIKDKEIRIVELESKNLELVKTIDNLNEELLKNKKNEYAENESMKIKDLCFDLKDICSKLELEIKEKNYIIEELTKRLNQSENKNKDNQVILELSEFRIQNFNDNIKYYQDKINELCDKLKTKESENAIFQDFNNRLKEEKENLSYENVSLIEKNAQLQKENELLKKEIMLLKSGGNNINSESSNNIHGNTVNNENGYNNDNNLSSEFVSMDNSAFLMDKSYETNNQVMNYGINEGKHQNSLIKRTLTFGNANKQTWKDNGDLTTKINNLSEENNLLVKENEELFHKLEQVSNENVKIRNELLYAKTDAEKYLFHLDHEKKQNGKYKLLLKQKKRKGNELKRTFNKMMLTVKNLVVNIKKIDRENKKNDINNSFFISSSSENNSNDEYFSENDKASTNFMLSSVEKSRKSANSTTVDARSSFYSKSTTTLGISDNGNIPLSIFKNRTISNNNETITKRVSNNNNIGGFDKKTKKKTIKGVYIKIRMHRFSICDNFRIDAKKYKKACREIDSTLNNINEIENNMNLNQLNSQQRIDSKGLDTFYSIPNSCNSKLIEFEKGDEINDAQNSENIIIERNNHKKTRGKNNQLFSTFQTKKMINDLNYIKRKYDSKIKETLNMQKKLMDNEKELNCNHVKYVNLLNEHDLLITEIKERTDKLTSIEKDYNVLFAKYSEKQDEIKMHEKKTQEVFNECNELVKYMENKEKKINEFDEDLKKMEMKYKEEKEKNDILTKDNISLDNINSKYKEDIDLYKKKIESMKTELKLRLTKIEELELIQKNTENEMFYLKSATYKYDVSLKEAHDELNKINDETSRLRKELRENQMNTNTLKEQILNRDYFLYNVNESYKKKEYFYTNLKHKIGGFYKTFIELCENFEMGEIKKFNELYENFEFNDDEYRKNVINFQLKDKDKFSNSVEDIVKTVDRLSEFNAYYEEEKNDMMNKIKELENKLKIKMNEYNQLYEQYDNNMKNIIIDRDDRVADCLILSEDVKKKNAEINLLMKELDGKNIEYNEMQMKCNFLSNEVQALENSKLDMKEKFNDIELQREKEIEFLKKENEALKEDIYNVKKIIQNVDDEIMSLKETINNLKQEKYNYEKEIDKLRDILEEEKRYHDMLKENEENFIKEIKEAHQYAIKKEEEISSLRRDSEMNQKNHIDEIEKLKLKNREIQDSIKNHLKMVSDLELQMLEYKVLLDKNTSMKMLVQDLENKIDELIKDNEKQSIDLKKEKLINEEKEKNILALHEDIKMLETKINENDSILLKLNDEKAQLNQEIFILNDIKNNKDNIIEELENNLRKAVFGDIKINDLEKTQFEHKVFTDEDLGINMANNMSYGNPGDSKMCIFNNNTNNNGTYFNNVIELKKYSLFLKEENDTIKQELRKMKDQSYINERKNAEMEKILEKRNDIIQKMNDEIVSYNEKMKNLEKDTSQLNSELYAANELLALRSDECKELSIELYELTDVKNKLIVQNEVFQKQINFYKQQVDEKSELLNNLDMKKEEENNKQYEQNMLFDEYNRTLNFYYKICSHIIYYKQCVEKELSDRKQIDAKSINEESIIKNDRYGIKGNLNNDRDDNRKNTDNDDDIEIFKSINISNFNDSHNNIMENIKMNNTSEISNYINEFLNCVRLLIFKKRVFESKLESAEKKYNSFKEKLKEDRDLIWDLKKKLRQKEELNMDKKNMFEFSKDKNIEVKDFSMNYKDLSNSIHEYVNKNDVMEKGKELLILKHENDKLVEENKFLHEQIMNYTNLKNSVNEINKKKEFNEKENAPSDYTYVAENKYLKFQIDTISNELNVYRNKNDYLKKKTANYEDIITNLQKELIVIIDKQKECDKEYYKMEKELENKNKNIEHLIKKRNEDKEYMDSEYARCLKLEKELLSLTDDIFKKDYKIKEYAEIVKKLNEDIKEHVLEKEEIKKYNEKLKKKYSIFENKYNELSHIFETNEKANKENDNKNENDFINKLKNHENIISDLLRGKESLINEYEDLKANYDKKLKIESLLNTEVDQLKIENKMLMEKNNELIDEVNKLIKQNEKYNINLVDMDKEKFDIYMKYLKATEELNNITSSSLNEDISANKTKNGNDSHENIDKNYKENIEKFFLSKEKSLKEKEQLIDDKLNHLKEYEKELAISKDKLRNSVRQMKESQNELYTIEKSNIVINNLKKDINILSIENDTLKAKIKDMERLNDTIFNDNKELIKVISSLEEKYNNGVNISKNEGRNDNSKFINKSYGDADKNELLKSQEKIENEIKMIEMENHTKNLINENRLGKEENENLKIEIYKLKNQIDEYSETLSKRFKYKENNKKAKNYLYYLNDKIKGLIEIFRENNFNYEFFKNELKKIKSANLMIINDNFDDLSPIPKMEDRDDNNSPYSEMHTDVGSDHMSARNSKLEDDENIEDNASMSSKIIVNMLGSYWKNSNEDGIVIDKVKLNKIYKYVMKLKENYCDKELIVRNQKNIIEELKNEIDNYINLNKKYEEDNIDLNNKVNELVQENSSNVQKFSKIHENLITKLEEEVHKNNNMLEELNALNSKIKVYEENQIQIENALKLQNLNIDNSIYKNDEHIENSNLKKITILLKEYNELVQNNSNLLLTNGDILSENDELKNIIKKMNDDIDILTKELNEEKNKNGSDGYKNNSRNSRHSQSEQRDLLNSMLTSHDQKISILKKRLVDNGDINDTIKQYEEIIMAIEKKNNELENDCEFYKQHNSELSDNYNQLITDYNSLKDFIKKKKIEINFSDIQNSKNGIRNSFTQDNLNKGYIENKDLLTIKNHINSIEKLNNELLNNKQVEMYINLVKRDIDYLLKNKQNDQINKINKSNDELINQIIEKEDEIKNYQEIIDNLKSRIDNKDEIINNLKRNSEEFRKMLNLMRTQNNNDRIESANNLSNNSRLENEENNEGNKGDNFALSQKDDMLIKIRAGYENLLNEYNDSITTLEETKEKLEMLKHEKIKLERLKEAEMNDKEYIIKKLELINTQIKEKSIEQNKSLNDEIQLKDNVIQNKIELINDLHKEIDILKEGKNKNLKYINDLELQIVNLNNEIDTLKNILDDSKDEMKLLSNELDKKENTIHILKTDIKRISNSIKGENNDSQNEQYKNGSNRKSVLSSRKTHSNSSMVKQNERNNNDEQNLDDDGNERQYNNILNQSHLHFEKINELRMELKNSFENYNKLKFDNKKKLKDYEDEANSLKSYIKKIKDENEKKDKKYALIELAIKEMDKEIILLKDDIKQKSLYINDLEMNVDKKKREIELIVNDINNVQHIVMNYFQNENSSIEELTKKINTQMNTKHLLFIKEIVIKFHHRNSRKGRESKVRENADDENLSIKERELINLQNELNNVISEKEMHSDIIKDMKHQLDEFHDQKNKYISELRSMEKELDIKRDEMKKFNIKLEEINRREESLVYKENEFIQIKEEIMNRERDIIDREHEITEKINELSHKEKELIEKEHELINKESDILKNNEDFINTNNELERKREELNNEQIQIEELKNDLILKFEHLHNEQKDIKIKETKLKTIYKKLKNNSINDLLDASNDDNLFNSRTRSNINGNNNEHENSNISSVRKIAELDNLENQSENLNLDSLEYTTYFNEFKKKIKNLKQDLQSREKELEFFEKTLEIEKREKEEYRNELDNLKNLLHAEQLNKKNLDDQLERYKNDDEHIIKSLKESEEIINEKNELILELQQKLAQASYEISMIENKSNKKSNNSSYNGERHSEYEKKIEELNNITNSYEKEINELNKEKENITKHFMEKIMDDEEGIKKLKDELNDANTLIVNLKNKNNELYNANIEMEQANKDMRDDIDILLSNIDKLNDEKNITENEKEQKELKYNELKINYDHKVKECNKFFNMLPPKMKRKIEYEKKHRNSKDGIINMSQFNSSITSKDHDALGNSSEEGTCDIDKIVNGVEDGHNDKRASNKINDILNEKDMVIESLSTKLLYYEEDNAKHHEIINDYKSKIDELLSKLNIFEGNMPFFIKINEIINENNYTHENVLGLLNNAILYRKIIKKIFIENQFYKEIIQIKEYIFDIISKNTSSKKKETLKLSMIKKKGSPKKGHHSVTHPNYPSHMSDAIRKYQNPNDEDQFMDEMDIEPETNIIIKAVNDEFDTFESICNELYNLNKNEEWDIMYKKLNVLEYSYNSIINIIINEIKKTNKISNIEKSELKKNMKLLKKKYNSLSNDFLQNVEDVDKLKLILVKESEQNELLIAENEELKNLYKELTDEYNEKLDLIKQNEYQIKKLQDQLIEKNENRTKTEEINEFLKTDLDYLNNSLEKANQSLSNLNSENEKNKIALKQLTEENIYLKNQIEDKKENIEYLTQKIKSNDQVINELKEFNEMLIKKVETYDSIEELNRKEGNNHTKGHAANSSTTELYDHNRYYEGVDKNELLVVISKLENDNNNLKEECDMLKNDFYILSEKNHELEEIIQKNDLPIKYNDELEIKNDIIEKETLINERNKYKIKCIQIIDICFNKDFTIVDIREKIIAIFENDDDEIINIINCHRSMLSNHTNEEFGYDKENNTIKNGRHSRSIRGTKSVCSITDNNQYNENESIKDRMSSQRKDDTTKTHQEKITHIEEMSKKNEELIKKNEQIWKLNKYIEDLNKEITNKDYIIMKSQQESADKNEVLEKNKQYIIFLKDQIKLLCNNIDENNLFDIDNVNLSPTLRSFIKRKSYNNRCSFVEGYDEKKSNHGHENEDFASKQKRRETFDLSRKKRLSEFTCQEPYDFYDENEVKIEEMNLKMDELNDKLKTAEHKIEALKNENTDLMEKCEFLKKELKDVQGAKRNLMLCESRLNILEKELEEKQKKLDAQNKTVNECVDIYVEENSENFNKILELKQANEKYKIEIKVLNDEITQLKADVKNYNNDIKNINSTLEFYKSTHDELVNEFGKEETNKLYYQKICDMLKKENENFKEQIEIEEENKKELINSINEIKEQLNNAMKENNEIALDVEYFQMQNDLLKDFCKHYKERERILINNIEDDLDGSINTSSLKNIQSYKGESLKSFVMKLNEEINNLQNEIEGKSESIVSLKYQIKEYHLDKISKNNEHLQYSNITSEEVVDINNITYVQNNLFIYINLFKSVLFIISEILFFIDPTNSLYFEILSLLKLKRNKDHNKDIEIDAAIKPLQLSKGECDNIFKSILKSKNLLREKLQLLQLKIC
ncbi:conserved Plasmodium protein, unknown function [Plasmodium vinckei brucechwatti]|uniref:Uncharacterized protein n=1 Tax=Plasmodium vinckei brucechwatti TaxID=119398 RepID=A0A6V7T1B9_PLAVN|nr:conserved Plasmodium protein, unknown function [Plasmodium vinckei brucechwatti]